MGTSTFTKIVKSRTVWGIAILGAIPVLQAIAPMVPSGTKTGAVLTIILAGYTIYCRISAKQALGPVIDQTIAQTVEAVHVLGLTDGQPATTAGQVAQTKEVTAVVKASQ